MTAYAKISDTVMDNGQESHTGEVENQENIRPGDLIDIKVTPVVSKLVEEGSTPVSSAGEDDDAPDFEDMLKNDPTWSPPSEEVETKIRTLMEQYFSDKNLTKDKFLLKHVKRNKHGYVSVKLLTSFKKIKNLSRDWRITAYSILKSEKLEINRNGTKLRRKEPCPEIDLPTTSIKTVLYKLGDGQEAPSLPKVSEKFREYGELMTIQIVQPGTNVPIHLKNHITKHPELGQSLCIVVEFETIDAAQNAYKALSRIAREEEATESYCLLGSGRNPRKVKNKEGYDSNDESPAPSPYTSSRENSPMPGRKKFVTAKNGLQQIASRFSVSPLVSPQGSRDASPDRGSGHSGRSPRGSPRMQRKNIGGQMISPPSSGSWRTGMGTPENTSPRGSPRGSPMSGRKQHASQSKKSPLTFPNNVADSGSNNSTPSGSPRLQRKQMLTVNQGVSSPSGSPSSSPVPGRKFQYGVPVGVIRLPRGPPSINTKGFDVAWNRKIKTASVVKNLPNST